jgi:hypothetical protein
MGSEDFVTHFLNEVLFQDVVHIDDIIILRNTQIALGILFSCVTNRPCYLIRKIPLSFFFHIYFWANFNNKVM